MLQRGQPERLAAWRVQRGDVNACPLPRGVALSGAAQIAAVVGESGPPAEHRWRDTPWKVRKRTRGERAFIDRSYRVAVCGGWCAIRRTSAGGASLHQAHRVTVLLELAQAEDGSLLATRAACNARVVRSSQPSFGRTEIGVGNGLTATRVRAGAAMTRALAREPCDRSARAGSGATVQRSAGRLDVKDVELAPRLLGASREGQL